MNTPGDTSDRASVHSRLVDAPPARVFRCIQDPVYLARWWGPHGFSSTFEVFDFRPHGDWRFTFHGPDGTQYPNHNVFREIAPDRVLLEHISDEHHFLLTITLVAEGDRTRVGWRQVFDTVEHYRAMQPLVSRANEENLDRLAAEVRNVA